MKTIILNNMEGFDFADVYKYIMGDPDNQFEVQFYKKYFGKKEHHSTFVNYCNAAFIGERLFNISRLFTYWVPTNLINDPFIFEVEIYDREKFVDVIYYVVSSCINYYNHDLCAKFEAKVLAFYKTATKLHPNYACWGLLEKATVYRKRHERKEKRKMQLERLAAWKRKFPFFIIQ